MAQDVTITAAAERDAKAAQEPPADVVDKDAIADRHCLRATGSRFVAMQNRKDEKAGKAGEHCAIGPGRVHTSEDLGSTGATSLGDALRRLEPSSR